MLLTFVCVHKPSWLSRHNIVFAYTTIFVFIFIQLWNTSVLINNSFEHWGVHYPVTLANEKPVRSCFNFIQWWMQITVPKLKPEAVVISALLMGWRCVCGISEGRSLRSKNLIPPKASRHTQIRCGLWWWFNHRVIIMANSNLLLYQN